MEPRKKESRPKSFRVDTQQFFFTYPKCYVSKQELLEWLRNVFGRYERIIQGYVICKEDHQDGEPHLHAYIKLDSKHDCRDPLRFDYKGYHPNFQGVRSTNNVIAYVAKDKDYIFDGVDVQEALIKKLGLNTMAAKHVFEDKGNLATFARQHLQLASRYLSLKSNFEALQQDLAAEEKKDSVSKQGTRGVWIFGPPEIRKTAYCRKWCRDNKLSFYEKDNSKWWDGYVDQEVVIINDFGGKDGKHTGEIADFVKQMTEDELPFTFQKKNGTIRPLFNLVIVNSNYDPKDVFSAEGQTFINALLRRFTVHYRITNMVDDEEDFQKETSLKKKFNEDFLDL